MKRVPDLGFDTDSLILCVDYFGGGSAEFLELWRECDSFGNPADYLADTIVSCVQKSENLKKTDLVAVEWRN